MPDNPTDPPLVINGWTIYAHPIFLEQLETLIEEVERQKLRDPTTWRKKNCTKRLAAIFRLVTEIVPADPASPQFRQGGTLGADRKHWFRAKFFQQYRMFFRFHGGMKVIVFVWVNDDTTLRAYGSRSDAYATFKSMLESGNPPEDLTSLLKEAKSGSARFKTDLISSREI
ncbi:type II toxin-antitoxin system YhaV family toxin [Fulvimarina sp. MAC8]|uniref:type II toxin-antitoxin system YhaV family toxin n=1 Tax=Fulvimarina sp. MAC8 TaxID=3162874 RepID=UPI0032EE0DE2